MPSRSHAKSRISMITHFIRSRNNIFEMTHGSRYACGILIGVHPEREYASDWRCGSDGEPDLGLINYRLRSQLTLLGLQRKYLLYSTDSTVNWWLVSSLPPYYHNQHQKAAAMALYLPLPPLTVLQHYGYSRTV